MKRAFALLCLFLLGIALPAQQPGVPRDIVANQITLPLSSPPQMVSSGSAHVAGNPGNGIYYYWVVANFPIGNSSPAGPFVAINAPAVLSSSDAIQVSWSPVPGATGYDVLRTSTPQAPAGSCNCAVTIGTIGASITDQGSTLNSYLINTFDSSLLSASVINEADGLGTSALSLRFGALNRFNFDSSGKFTVPQIEQTRYADQWCNTNGTLDQSCIANAVASNVRLVIPAGTYTFTSSVTLAGLSNFEIDAQPGAVIRKDGPALECDSCSDFRIQGLVFATVTQPTVVTKSQLPTASPSTVVVIDRFSTGRGYIPTVNDSDIVPTASGGNCTSNCLSSSQSSETFDTGIILRNASTFRVTGLTGNYYSILCYDCDAGRVDHNYVAGGKEFAGGIVLWNATGTSAGNSDDEIDHNIITYSAYSGITVSKGDNIVIDGNVSSYNGESGIKEAQGAGNYSERLTVTNNAARYNWYDGFDLSEDYPHTGAVVCGCAASGNISSYNGHAGFYMDGQQWVVTGNHIEHNGTFGMGLDLSDSSISSNDVANNNTSNTVSGVHQIAIGVGVTPHDDVVSSNEVFVNNSAPGYAMDIGGDGTMLVADNRSYGSTDYFTAGVGLLNNSDSTGMLANTTQTFAGLLYQTNNTGSSLPAGTTNGSYTVGLNNAIGQADVDYLNLYKSAQNTYYAFRWFVYDAAGASHNIVSIDRQGNITAAGASLSGTLNANVIEQNGVSVIYTAQTFSNGNAQSAFPSGVTANQLSLYALEIPAALQASKISYWVDAGDATTTDAYSLGIYNSSGTLVAHVAPIDWQYSGTARTDSLVEGTVTLPAGIYFVGLTGDAAAATLYSVCGAQKSFVDFASSSYAATTSGALPATIAAPTLAPAQGCAPYIFLSK